MADFEYLDVSTAGKIATVVMKRPPVNAVHQPMYAELTDCFARIEELAPDAGVVILTGDGRHFCGGNDLEEFLTMTPENSRPRMRAVREAFAAIYDSVLPVIAAVHGVAVGTGVAIAGSCDLVIAAEGARLGLPEVQVGAMGGAKHLSRIVPQGVVRRMHLTGDTVPVEELVQYGGIVRVVPPETLLDEARELAASIARHSSIAVRAAKRSLNQIEYLDVKAGYQFEQSLTTDLSAHPDAKEAVTAFFERREPRYSDR